MATPPDFSVGQVLTAAHMDAVGLWLIKTETIGSAVASVTVSDAFSADYDNYKITISGGASSTNGGLSLQLGSTTTGYYAGYSLTTYSTGAGSNASDNNGSNWAAVGNMTTTSLTMNIDLLSPYLTEHTFIYGITAGASVARSVGGYLNDTTSYTAFTITPTSGTITGGTIRVYGYRN